jgi:putative tryptophan/tyrosine transport system substrate-binding protein
VERRAFIGTLASGLLAAPLVAEGQQARKVYRVGYIGPTPVATLISDPSFNSFRREMGQRGYVEGQDLVLELRSVEERPDRASEVVGELVRLNPDVIVERAGDSSRPTSDQDNPHRYGRRR